MKIILAILFIVFNSTLIASELGKATYEMTCKTCHDPRVSEGIHAPAAFNKKEWGIRFKKAAMESKNKPVQFKTSMDYLLYRVGIGKGLMPHGGLCKEAPVANKNCSDKAMAEAIYYMADISENNDGIKVDLPGR